MWDRVEDRLALLELLTEGRLRRRQGQQDAWTWLRELPWTRLTGRRDELELVGPARVGDLLDRVWPGWLAVQSQLVGGGYPPTPTGWHALQDLLRAARVRDLPDRLNRRTALSEVAPHSKSQLTATRRAALGHTEVTHDGIVRLRPPAGLRIRRGEAEMSVDGAIAVLGEIALSDRAMRDGAELVGWMAGLLLVENLGAWQDLTPPPGWLVAHVPGWDTATVKLLLAKIGQIPVLHFGDLDPNGLRIHRHLAGIRPGLRWVVPAFWAELVDTKALSGEWPDDLDLDGTPALVRRLARDDLWLEQESIVLDPRLVAEITALT